LTIRRNGDIDQPRILFGELPVPDPPGIHFPRRKGLDHHTRLLGQGGEGLPILRTVFDVQGHVSFVPPFHHEGDTNTLDVSAVRGHLATGVSFGGFDLDDLRPKFGKEARGDDPGEICLAGIKDHDIIENLGASLRILKLFQRLLPHRGVRGTA